VQSVDFAIWQAADGSWQLQSCIRGTRAAGEGRVFYRWEGPSLTEPDWRPVGIAMQADAAAGETPGGLQAPFTIKLGGEYRMLYGDWQNVCQAVSRDGKSFQRLLGPDGRSGMFAEGEAANARDPMVLSLGGEFVVYYAAHPGGRGAVYARTSSDLRTWSASRIVAAGGEAGSGPFSAECPFVVFRPEAAAYFLFRTQRYGLAAETRVYRSPDPMDFGLDDDRHLVTLLPVAAPELIEHAGATYVAALSPDLKGVRIARLGWVRQPRL